MPTVIDHPVVLVVVALLCSPLLLPLARWFFDDLETFLGELGYREQDDIWWQLIRGSSGMLRIKVVGFVGTFAIVVGMVYLFIVHIAF
jgi:hypothetical protein